MKLLLEKYSDGDPNSLPDACDNVAPNENVAGKYADGNHNLTPNMNDNTTPNETIARNMPMVALTH